MLAFALEIDERRILDIPPIRNDEKAALGRLIFLLLEGVVEGDVEGAVGQLNSMEVPSVA